MILIGFSQGGHMSAEIAARYAERYVGAIVMSAGGIGDVALQGAGANGTWPADAPDYVVES